MIPHVITFYLFSKSVDEVFMFLWLRTNHEEEDNCGGRIRDDANSNVLEEVFIKSLFEKIGSYVFFKKIDYQKCFACHYLDYSNSWLYLI